MKWIPNVQQTFYAYAIDHIGHLQLVWEGGLDLHIKTDSIKIMRIEKLCCWSLIFITFGGSYRSRLFWRETQKVSLLAAGVLGHSLGSFTHGVFGQFTEQKQPDGGLDLAEADG